MPRVRVRENGRWVIRDTSSGDRSPWRSRNDSNTDKISSLTQIEEPTIAKPEPSEHTSNGAGELPLDASTLEHEDSVDLDDHGVFLGKFELHPTKAPRPPLSMQSTKPQTPIVKHPGMLYDDFVKANWNHITHTQAHISHLLRGKEEIDGQGTVLQWAAHPQGRPSLNQANMSSVVLAEVSRFEIVTGCREKTAKKLFGRSLDLTQGCYEAEGRCIAQGVKEMAALEEKEMWADYRETLLGKAG